MSYFNEPSPCKRGCLDRYAYQSHALRFAVCRPLECGEHFRSRINAQAAAQDQGLQLVVFPTMGWWRNRPSHGRFERPARYSLVVSIEAPAVEQDLYASVAQQIAVPVAIEIPA